MNEENKIPVEGQDEDRMTLDSEAAKIFVSGFAHGFMASGAEGNWEDAWETFMKDSGAEWAEKEQDDAAQPDEKEDER